MQQVKVTKQNNVSDSYEFFVEVGEHRYKVSLTDDYWQQLTGKNVSPEKLVEESFKFLLDREPPESILPEFDLPKIGHYFPEYEQTIKNAVT